MFLSVQITITKSYKLCTIIIYTKLTNNNDISFKSFTMKILKKGSLMMMLMFKKVP